MVTTEREDLVGRHSTARAKEASRQQAQSMRNCDVDNRGKHLVGKEVHQRDAWWDLR